jgi:DNA-binding NarL/FixJ family response regulator
VYKLLIVEDEVWEREGLTDFLNWSELDIEVVGTAANGFGSYFDSFVRVYIFSWIYSRNG